jgi:signal transduction histidine kinase
VVVTDAVRSLWAEPRVPDPPAPNWRDAAIVAVAAPAAVLEATFGEDRTWPVVSVVVIVALLPTVFVRRTHPLLAVGLTFGTFAAIDLAALAAGVEWEGLGAGAYVLVLLYALFRWGSGREAVTGLAIALVPIALTIAHEMPAGDVIGGTILLLCVAAVGASVRYQANAQARGMDEIKVREREQLARELHDTVAHHVSAIAIQAQAGRTVAASRPGAALEALAVIEEEASRTLDEMRAMVSALRQGEEPDLAPQRGVADIARLAAGADGGQRPRIDVELTGDLEGLWPPVDAALFRLAQEAITNALRHARHATRIQVRVVGDDDHVRLTVDDDGDAPATAPTGAGRASGYGLVGMAERTHLLGGTLDAGPGRDGGWTVHAVLPRTPGSGVVA